VVRGQADHVITTGTERTAIDAKYTDGWMGTLRNPLSVIGLMPWSEKEQREMVEQARRYSSVYDGGIIYHTNSFEFAKFCTKVFDKAGIKKYRFIITPSR
jgi:filamentous hemagglutinin